MNYHRHGESRASGRQEDFAEPLVLCFCTVDQRAEIVLKTELGDPCAQVVQRSGHRLGRVAGLLRVIPQCLLVAIPFGDNVLGWPTAQRCGTAT